MIHRVGLQSVLHLSWVFWLFDYACLFQRDCLSLVRSAHLTEESIFLQSVFSNVSTWICFPRARCIVSSFHCHQRLASTQFWMAERSLTCIQTCGSPISIASEIYFPNYSWCSSRIKSMGMIWNNRSMKSSSLLQESRHLSQRHLFIQPIHLIKSSNHHQQQQQQVKRLGISYVYKHPHQLFSRIPFIHSLWSVFPLFTGHLLCILR